MSVAAGVRFLSTTLQTWPPALSASLGDASTLTYSDGVDFDGVVVRADRGTVVDGISRSVVLKIECANESEAHPTFVEEVSNIVEYRFKWKRKEACDGGCGNPPNPHPPKFAPLCKPKTLASVSELLKFLSDCLSVADQRESICSCYRDFHFDLEAFSNCSTVLGARKTAKIGREKFC